ncbi:MAG: two-component regulator propeller domain-containing protein [Bryobacteraceae bacterium]|nr:two-component regulator propeller domain-containing protein [Bryobacteraceae bacterium]
MKKPLAAAAFCLLIANPARPETLPIRTYTTQDGLAHNHINRIKVDSHGFLWFCTDAGVSRFDGRQFLTLTTEDGLPHPDVNDLVEARDGAFWLAGDGGISRFRLRSPGTNEKPRIDTFRAAGYPGERYDAIEFDLAGRLWAGGHEGLYRIDTTAGRVSWTARVVPGAAIPRLLAGREGGLWIATTHGAVYRDAGGRQTPVVLSPLSANPFAQSLLQDRAGTVWIGYRAGGFCRLSVADETIKPLDCIAEQDGQTIADVRSIFESSDGRFWLGTTQSGLCEFERKERKLTCYGKEHGLPEDWIPRVAEDPQGNLWLGTLDRGVSRLSRPGFVQVVEDGPAGFLSLIMETRTGWLVAAAHNGVVRTLARVGRRWQEVWRSRFPRAPYDYAWPRQQGLLEDSQGNWWIPAGRHLYRYPFAAGSPAPRPPDPETFQLPPGLWYSRIIEDSPGAVWASVVVPGNAAKRDARWVVVRDKAGGAFREVPVIEAAMARVEKSIGIGAYISCFQNGSDGALWIGISSNRLIYTGNVVTLLRYHRGRVREFSMADGLPPGNINAIHRDRLGRLWLATNAGLGRLDDAQSERPKFARYAQAEGLASTEVLCVTEDGQGRIYAGTAKGVERLDPRTGRFRHFSVEDGLPAGRVQAAVSDRSGRLWFATDNVVSRFEPETVAPRPPGIYTVYPSGPLTLAYGRSYFEARFSSPNFGGPPPRFQYRLAGADQDWGPPAAEGVVRYAGMSPGSYELQVRAVNAEGLVSPQPVGLRLSVTPPFWRTWWFLALALGAAGALAYWLHRYRVEQLLAVERLRIRIASDLHDDIGSTLSQVSMLGELAKRSLNGANPGVSELIERMAGASRDAVSAMGDIVWSIHPRNDRLSRLAQRMRSFASDVLSARDIDFDFDTPDTGSEPAISLEARRDLLLIFKESVTNAARHSGCARVRASLRQEGREVRLIVEDDGKGFDTGRESNGHGLGTMRARVEKLGGRCEVRSGNGAGTRIAVSIPAGERLL